MNPDPELLEGLNEAELEALAESSLSPSGQARMDELLARRTEGPLSDAEQRELDVIIERVDQLNILRTRARYTLHRQQVGAAGS